MNRSRFALGLVTMAAALSMASSPAQAGTVVLDVAGIPSHGLRGDVQNTVVWVNVGADALVDYLAWNVGIGSYYSDDPWPATIYSWMDELGVAFTNSTQTAGFALRPGWQTDGPGGIDPGNPSHPGAHFDGAGTLGDLSPGEVRPDGPGWFQEPVANLYDNRPDFHVGSDGLLRVEFYEIRLKDFPSSQPDGRWVSGDLSFGVTSAVPEPRTGALMLAGLLGLGFLTNRARAQA